jgi:polysaccharide biosynthesis/export protein
MKSMVAIRFPVIVALTFALHSATAHAASSPAGPATLESVTFEIQPDEITARIATSVPVPRYQCDFGPAGDPVLTFTDVSSRLEGQYEPPVAFLGALRVEAPADGSRGRAVLRFRMRSASLVGIEQRADGVALRFVASAAGAENGDYRVGIGDKLEIAVFGHDDLVKTSEVGVEGTINFPLVGDLKVEGRTVAEIDDELTKRLASEYLVDPQVNVEVKEFRSQWVTLMGEVRTPGRYALRRNMRLLDVIAEAGGPTKEAGQEIAITRHEPKTGKVQQLRVRMDDLLTANSPADNLDLHHGDIISIGERAVFYIRGEVNRPSAFVLERGMTVMRAIAVAGGLTQYANRKEVQLVRSGTEGALESITVNLKAIEDGKVADQPLRPDDVIIVPRRIF